jgi:hypothetical protein
MDSVVLYLKFLLFGLSKITDPVSHKNIGELIGGLGGSK